jgi:hypothetical protein
MKTQAENCFNCVYSQWDRKAVELFGDFARLNFPEEWPDERRRKLCEAATVGK